MKRIFCFSVALFFAVLAIGQNPVIPYPFTADPSLHKWSDGKFYIYGSHDKDVAGVWDMDDYHVYSSVNLVNWTDHGVVLRNSQTTWGGPFWAPDAAEKNGQYYLYFPEGDNIGVAVSSSPTGPFTNPTSIYTKPAGYAQSYDPAIFPYKGKNYLVISERKNLNTPFYPVIFTLKDNMVEIEPNSKVELTGLTGFHEGPFLFERNGKVYLTCGGAYALKYWMADDLFGPYEYKGEFLKGNDIFTISKTAHGSVLEFENQHYLAYHYDVIPGGPYQRTTCIDSLNFNIDGTIKMVTPTVKGIQSVKPLIDLCPNDPNKMSPGLCGCGVPEGTCPINVIALLISPAKTKMYPSTTKQLTNVFIPANTSDKTIRWTSSDSSIAVVNSNGLVTAIAVGKTTITATTSNGLKKGESIITVIPETPNYQAEDAEIKGAVVTSNQNGFNGIGYIDFTNDSDDFVSWSVRVPTASSYILSFRYALPSGNRPLKLTINGEERISSLEFPVTGGWTKWAEITTNQALNAGVNKITLTTIGSNGGNIDELAITIPSSNISNFIEYKEDSSIIVYPNPFTKGKLFIDIPELKNKGKVQIKIINTMEKTVYQKILKSSAHLVLKIPDALEKDTYIISIETKNKKFSKKLIVN